MTGLHRRQGKGLMQSALLAISLTLAASPSSGEVVASFHPQFHVKDTTSWDMCATNRGAANVSIGLADIYRITSGRLNVLNQSTRSYEMRMRPRNRWIRGIQIGTAIGSLLQATPAIDIGDGWQYLLPGIAGGFQIAQPAIEGNRRQDYETGVYWEGTRTLAPGESQCLMVMTLRIKDPKSFATVISGEVPMDPQGAMPSRNPPLAQLSYVARFDAIDWQQQAADAIKKEDHAPCVLRPTSVDAEDGCEKSWYDYPLLPPTSSSRF